MSAAGVLAGLGFFAASAAAAAPGVVFRPGAWYRRLAKPPWCPPDRLFAPVWTALYLCIALAGWQVWREEGGFASIALAVYGVHLVLNALWSVVFFGLRRPGWALIEIVFLWLGIVATIVMFFPIHRPAAYLLVPYMLWVSFAVGLNFSIWRRNKFDGSS